jgi:hypothetical protein
MKRFERRRRVKDRMPAADATSTHGVTYCRPRRAGGPNSNRFRDQVTNAGDAAGAPGDAAGRPMAQGNSAPLAHGNREPLALGRLAQRSREPVVDRNTDSECKRPRAALRHRDIVPKSSSNSYASRS